MWVAAEDFAGACAALLRCGDAGLTGGAVGIPGIDQGDAKAVLAALQVALSDDQRGGNHFVAGEHGGGGSRLVRHRAGKIRVPAGFQTGAYGGKREAARDLIITNEAERGTFQPCGLYSIKSES